MICMDLLDGVWSGFGLIVILMSFCGCFNFKNIFFSILLFVIFRVLLLMMLKGNKSLLEIKLVVMII